MSEYPESRSKPGKVISVSQLNRVVAQRLASSFPSVWVSGEVSNFTQAASGHCYFSLKDERAQVRAVMFRSRARAAGVSIRNGMQVEALGQIGLYEARGDFQLNVENVRLAGAGDLHQQFVQLKNKLQAEGLFDIERKKMLPPLPARIGVVTSLQAAALRDVLTTLARRAPQVPVIIYPTPVQGDDASGRIVSALQTASARKECDVLLLVRGGGSIEDLWSFNAEVVARAIRDCTMPVVVGVGHESDVTIADFAADMRAPTPTGAATTVVPEREELQRRVNGLARLMTQAWQNQHRQLEQRIDMAWRLVPSPAGQLRARQARVAAAARALVSQHRHLRQREQRRLAVALRQLRIPDTKLARNQLANVTQRLLRSTRQQQALLDQRTEAAAAQLGLVSPQAVMERGYSVLTTGQGAVIDRVGLLSQGDRVEILLADGDASASIERVGAATKVLPAGGPKKST
jgi:exodeoxyribonuclease VII large subunit